MGGSTWTYFVPYQSDINAALQQLREQVFASGIYFKHDHAEERTMSESEARQKAEQSVAITGEPELFEIMIDDWRYIKALPEPDTIEKLLEWNLTEGTHTILDINRGISEIPQFGTISPLHHDMLLKIFKTLYPTREQVSSWVKTGKFYEHIELRWDGIYIIVYENGQPVEICFTGVSGD